MIFKVTRASQSWDDKSFVEWEVNTIEELITKIEECGNDIILSKDGSITIFDAWVS